MAEGATPGRLVVGLVRGVRGLRGQVRVELLTDRPEDRFIPGARLFPEGTAGVLTIEEASAVADGPGWWLTFREVRDRESADELRGLYLEIENPKDAPEPGRWLWHELIGQPVRGLDGAELGEIVEIYRAGGAEVFLVRGPRGELDVPGVSGIVVSLDPGAGGMVVDLDALSLDARPVEDESYVRPRDRRPKKQPKVKGPKPAAAGASPGTANRPGPKPARVPKPRMAETPTETPTAETPAGGALTEPGPDTPPA